MTNIEDKLTPEEARKERGCSTLVWGVPSVINYSLAIYKAMQDNYDAKEIGFFLVMGTVLAVPAIIFGKEYRKK